MLQNFAVFIICLSHGVFEGLEHLYRDKHTIIISFIYIYFILLIRIPRLNYYILLYVHRNDYYWRAVFEFKFSGIIFYLDLICMYVCI